MTTPTPTRPHKPGFIDLDAILESARPDMMLGGQAFEARPVAWGAVVKFGALGMDEQFSQIVTMLRARARDVEAITDEWLEEHLTVDSKELVVQVLMGGRSVQELLLEVSERMNGHEADAGNRATRRAAKKASGKARPPRTG